MPKVSVIIAVYNMEKYLDQCLQSIINQTLKEIEIICIDDNSTDKSLEILRNYAQQDNRIIIISQQENFGQGAARNKALEVAKGDYIMFLDSDDWLEPEACECAFNQIKTNDNDFAYFNVYNFFENKQKKLIDKEKLKPFNFIANNPHIELFKLDFCFIKSAESCFKIYKREFLNNNNIRYSSEKLGEDVPFSIKAIVCAKNISIINKPIYNYRIHSSSTTTSKTKYYKQLLTAREEALNIVQNSNHSEAFLKPFLAYSINTLFFWFDRFSKKDITIAEDFYNEIRKTFKTYSLIFDINKIQKDIDYKRFENFLKYDWKQYKNFEFKQSIFSINKTNKHIIIKFLGFKLKIRRKQNEKDYNIRHI